MRNFFFDQIQQYLILDSLVAGARRANIAISARKSRNNAVESVKQQIYGSMTTDVMKTAQQKPNLFFLPTVLTMSQHTKKQLNMLMASSALFNKNLLMRNRLSLARNFSSCSSSFEVNGQNEASTRHKFFSNLSSSRSDRRGSFTMARAYAKPSSKQMQLEPLDKLTNTQ